MKINRLRILPLAVLFLFAVTSSCHKDDSVYFIKTDPVQLKVPQKGGTYHVVVQSNAGWSLDFPENWGSASINSANVGVTPVYMKLTFSANNGEKIRYQNLTFSSKSGNVQTLLVLAQAGTVEDFGDDPGDEPDEPPIPDTKEDTLSVEPQTLAFGGQGGLKTVRFTSNQKWSYVGSSQSWCRVLSVPPSEIQEAGVRTLTLFAERSSLTSGRTAIVTFVSSNDSLLTLQVTQRAPGIYVEEDLAAFRDSVNAGKHQAGFMDKDSVIQLYANMDLSDYPNWEPIGIYFGSKMRSIKGTFNGNGHTVHHLNITSSSSSLALGLFGYLDNATVQNLTVASDCAISATATNTGTYPLRVGGIVGYVDGGIVDNCHFMGTVSVYQPESSLQPYTGGIAGHVEYDSYYGTTAYVINSSNSGTITADSYVGGIAGYLYKSYVDNCQNKVTASVNGGSISGGIVGMSNGSTMEGSTNNGSVGGKEAVGGICGMQMGTSTIDGCVNNKDISATPDSEGSSDAVAGIVGASLDSFVAGCTNNGAISGVGEVGGVVGDAYGAFSEFENSHNYGTVTGNDAVGGICGKLTEGVKITSCTNHMDATVTSSSVGGGICGTTTDESASARVSGCTNLAAVNALEYAGGIVGWAYCDVESCTNSGAVVSTLTDTTSVSGGDGDQGITVDALSVTGSGGIAAIACGDVTSSTNSGEIKGLFAGGMVAWTYGSTYNNLTSCTNSGAVDGTRISGGVVAMNYGGHKVDTCLNSGAVTGLMYIGGIAGFNNTGKLYRCDNSGSVTGLTGEAEEYFFAGGVCGNNYRGTMESCYNKGAVARTDTLGESKYVGGLLGYNVASSANSASNGVIKTSVHSGTVNAYHNEESYAYVGAICGFFHSGTNDVDQDGGTRSTGTVTRVLPGGTTEEGVAGDLNYYFGGTN